MHAKRYMLQCSLATLAGLGTTASLTAARAQAQGGSVSLTSSLARPSKPTIVFIHGLDSAKDTWSTVQADLQKDQYPSIALDLRGHGESPLGDEEHFTPDTLASDIRQALIKHGIPKPFVLCGHSMGGMVVMRYCANYPSDVAALVIEDMDLRPRNRTKLTADELKNHRSFSRKFASYEQCKASLASFGYYTPGRIDGWLATGRVFPLPDGGYWSNINPMARYLAVDRVLASDNARRAFETLAREQMPMHLHVAGKGSVCKDDGDNGVTHMQQIVPRLKVTRFPDGYHSIHNTAREEFLSSLKAVVDDVAAPSTPPSSGSSSPSAKL